MKTSILAQTATPIAKTVNSTAKLNFNRNLNNAYRKSKTFNTNATKSVKQKISSMQTRGYRSKSCNSHYPNLTSTKATTNDIKKLLDKKLNTNNNTNNNQVSSKATIVKPFKKRSTSHMSRSNVRKEREDLLARKGK